MRTLTLSVSLFTAATLAAQSSLPQNYHTIFSNNDVVVMHVHYGAHEFVPMHDHPAVAALYVYLNDSGEVDIIHEGPGSVIAHRPPTHTGAFRIAPGLAERHSVQSNSDTPSDFLRVEFQHLAFPELPDAGKHVAAPASPTSGITTDFEDSSLRITRILCTPDTTCSPISLSDRSLLVAINPTHLFIGTKNMLMAPGDVLWLPAKSGFNFALSPVSHVLLVTFRQPTPDKK